MASNKAKPQKKRTDLALLKRLFPYIRPYKNWFRRAIIITIVMAFISPIRPMLVKMVVDNYVLLGNAQGLLWGCLAMVGVLIMEAIGSFFSSYSINRLGQSVILDLRKHLFAHLGKMKVRFFDRTPVGTLITRVVNDMETISSVFNEGLAIVFGDLLQLFVILAVMLATDWRLTLVSIATVPLLILATSIFKNAVKAAFQDVRNQVARLNAFVQEHINGLSIIKVFNRQDVEMQRFEAINTSHRKAHIRSVWHYSLFFPVVEILSAISLALLVWYGAGQVLQEQLTIGTLMAFTLYINMLFRPIRQLADRFNTLQMGVVSCERVFQLIDQNDFSYAEGQWQAAEIKGDVKFEQVWLAYEKKQWVLKNITFHAPAGKTIALVGATGSGKTSIIQLINRFYEHQQGKILIDDVEIRDISLDYLRKQVAVVQQDVFLFSDTIANNIRLGNENWTDKDIMEAAEAIGAAGFINQMPGKLQFQVMERGSMLSSGQRQLISLIRAFVANPAILVLDEATSSVDSETEHMVQLAIDKVTKGRTSIIIAHRLATVQNAHQILVLDQGEIKERGTHQQLLKAKGLYADLFDKQFMSVEI